MGGSRMAVGRTHTELKSLVSPVEEYAIRGVDQIEITPQHIRMRNFTASVTRQSVWAAATPITTRAPTGGTATYKRMSGGSRHHGQSVTVASLLRRPVKDEAFMFHRSVCDTSCSAL